jgi:hypothetical protein
MGAYGWPAQSSPTIGQCLNGGYGWLEVNLHRRHLDTSQRAMIAADLATLRDGQHKAGASADAATQSDAASLLKVILSHAVLQRFETSSSGVLVPATEGSTKPVTDRHQRRGRGRRAVRSANAVALSPFGHRSHECASSRCILLDSAAKKLPRFPSLTKKYFIDRAAG